MTSDESVANLIRRLRNHGLVDRNSVERWICLENGNTGCGSGGVHQLPK